LRESVNEFKARVNNYNVTHGLETGEVQKIGKIMGSGCMMCSMHETGHPKNVDYICSECIIKLLQTTQDEKRKAYAKAEKGESTQQMKALLMFITQEGENEDGIKVRNDERHIDRKRSVRNIRN